MKRKRESYELLTVPFHSVSETFDLSSLGELPEGHIRGMASVFGGIVDGAYMPTVIQRGAFSKTLQERSRSIPILWQHDMDEPIGQPVQLFENDFGLVLQASISQTARGKDALTLIRDGVVRALSIGFCPIKEDLEEQPDGSMLRYIREVRLVEISVVTLGADPNALITDAHSGRLAGRLEKYGESGPTETPGADTVESSEGAEAQSLPERFAAFVNSLEADLSDMEIVDRFAASLGAVPDTENTPADDLDGLIMAAELLAAQMQIDSLLNIEV